MVMSFNLNGRGWFEYLRKVIELNTDTKEENENKLIDHFEAMTVTSNNIKMFENREGKEHFY